MTVQSAANEDILEVVLTYTKLPYPPGTQPVLWEYDGDIEGDHHGSMTIPPTDTGSGPMETWDQIASYDYTYLGIVPEASTSLLACASLASFLLRRRRS